MSLKNVCDWSVSDVLAWLAKNKRRLDSAEAFQVYVHQESITGETLLGFTKQDCSRFGLIRPNDFEKILDKLRKENDKLKKEEKRRLDRAAKKKSKKNAIFGGDSKDSGVDDCSVSESFDAGRRPISILQDSDSPSSASTSGTASFGHGVSVSGGSTHKLVSNSVQAVTYEEEPPVNRPVVDEATYIAPEEIHRTASWVSHESQEEQEYLNPEEISSHGTRLHSVSRCEPESVVHTTNYYESTIQVNVVLDVDGTQPEQAGPPPTRPVPTQPHLYPTLPDPATFDPDPEALYENYEEPCETVQQDELDGEWDHPELTYMNQTPGEEGYIQEDIYENNPETSSSEEASSDEEGPLQGQNNLEDISRRLTIAFKGLSETTPPMPVRPPVLPPQNPLPVARRPVEHPLAASPTPSSKPFTPTRDVNSPPPLPPNKPKHVFESNGPVVKRVSVAAIPPATPVKPVVVHRQTTVPNLPSPDSGTLSIKQRMEMLKMPIEKEPEKEGSLDISVELYPTTTGGLSLKERQQKIGNLFGGSGPMFPPPPHSAASVVDKKHQPSTPPSQPGNLPPPPPPVSGIPPTFHAPLPVLPSRDPPPPLSARDPPPPPSTNLSKGCYQDVEISFPGPAARAPLPPPPGGSSLFPPPPIRSPSVGDDDDGDLYALEPDAEPDDIYNDGDEVIPGYYPHVSSRQQAEQLLRNDARSECYLIRDSTNGADQYPHVISLKAYGSFEHTRLGSRQNGRLAIGTAKPGETTHPSLAGLVHYHAVTPLNLRGRNVLLKHPVQIS